MKNIVRVWFNHWFSTAYHIISLLRQDDDTGFFIIGSGSNPDSVIRRVCDEWFEEPQNCHEDEHRYVLFCRDFCRDRHIDVFVPRRGLQAIGKSIDLFDEIGVRVLVERDYQKLSALNNKEKTYCMFEDRDIGHVPPRYVVNSCGAFCRAYEALTSTFERACFKLTKDEGAASFRVIDNSIGGYNGLYRHRGMKVTLDEAINALNQRESLPDILIMPYMEGHEVSVDCLRTDSGIIIIPRVKTGGRTEEIRYDDEIVQFCERFYEKIGISGPCNIQLKYHDGVPYLLEVNTRMSGGIQLSCIAAGVNIPNLAVNQLLGIEKPWSMDNAPKKVSFIEMPVVL